MGAATSNIHYKYIVNCSLVASWKNLFYLSAIIKNMQKDASRKVQRESLDESESLTCAS